MPAISDSGGHEIRPVRQRHVLPWIWLTLAVVLGFFLFTEHRAHLLGALPFLLILLIVLVFPMGIGGALQRLLASRPR